VLCNNTIIFLILYSTNGRYMDDYMVLVIEKEKLECLNKN